MRNHRIASCLTAARVFDGETMHTGVAVLVRESTIEKIDPLSQMPSEHVRRIDLEDATLLPGVIELHSHVEFGSVPERIVLEHSVTTARDLGGPVHAPRGGIGALRVLTTGPILSTVAPLRSK